MRKYSIGSRFVALLLLVAMLLPLLPTMEVPTEAAEVTDTPTFLLAADDGVTMLNNGNNIAMSIKINNFATDGLLFDYLSSFTREYNATDYLWEDTGKTTCIQLYPFKVRADLGIDVKTTTGFAHATGFSGGINATYSLDATQSTTDVYGYHSTYGYVQRTILPEVYKNYTDKVSYASDIGASDTPYVRLYPRGYKLDYYGNAASYLKGRAWIKLTTFANTQKVDNVRYVTIVYRLPHGVNNSVDSGYSNFGLTINSMDEVNGNCSKFATIDTAGGTQWQYAIIDLMGLGTKDTRRITSGTNVNEVYLQAPFKWSQNGSQVGSSIGTASDAVYMDIAAVGYFPYYGDAEQFAYYGLTLGCQQKYFADDNAGFSLRNRSRTYDSTKSWLQVKSLPTFYDNEEFLGSRPFGVDTYDTAVYSSTTQSIQALMDVLNPNADGTTNTLFESTGTMLFGDIKGQAALGLVEAELGENGQPVYKESVVHYIAAYLRNQLMTIPEYPSDNYGWRNYSYITGSSTTGGTNEALFGKNDLGQSIDLATALCNAIGVEKGAAITSGIGNFGNAGNYDYSLVEDNCYYGSYAKTIAHKDELIGTWEECKDNIHTWHDAAYFLLHNLYVSETDVADTEVDGYGEYEADYQSLIMPQIQYTVGNSTTTPYFFDSGYAYNSNPEDNSTSSNWSSALTFNKNTHTITLNGDADGVALFSNDGIADENPSCWFPFLPTSGNNPAGEANTPYYQHGGAYGRKAMGTTYRDRDFNYTLSGNGYFAYESNLYFNFQGDDDVYVFINGQLVIDIGGTHGATTYDMRLDDYVEWAKGIKYNGKTYDGATNGPTYAELSESQKARVDALCLVTGGVYSFDFFYMERHGVGSNLRIMTNMKIMESGLDVDKQAWQNGVEVNDNGIVDVNEPIEYGFSITNNSSGKLYNLTFSDDIIGISLDPENGLQVTGNITNSLGAKLTPSNLVITVDGIDADGNQIETVNVSCADNAALIQFLQTLSSEGTQSGDATQDYDQPYSGSGLWKDATVTIRGIYYRLTETQKSVISFTNSVDGSGFVKVAGENGTIEDSVLRGTAQHTVYQPGQPAYYQWVGHPIVIESERLYEDLIAGNIVDSASELPLPGNMILIPSDSSGLEVASDGISNVPGGDVYLTVNYSKAGSHMAYVTIRDSSNPDYSMTVPLTIYAVGGQDSIFVLDYGLDTYLTENNALFENELDAAAGDVAGSLLGIADDTITPSYQEYDASKIESAVGQISNDLTLVNGTYDSSTGTHGSKAVYELEKPIYLDHNKPWVLEWRGKNESALLFSSMKTSTTGNTYIYTNGSTGVFIGEDAPEHFTATGGTGDVYNNYGVKSSLISSSTVKTYALVNRPDGAGGNTIHLYVDGVWVGTMTGYHQASTAYTQDTDGEATNADWVNGRDFTFTHMGTTGHGLDGVYDFIHVYEDGYQLTHYKWEMPEGNSAGDKVINNVDTGDTGYVENGTTWYDFTINGNHKNYWQLNEPVTLAHDENWEVTMTLEGITAGTVIMSAQDNSQNNSTHIYFASGTDYQNVHMGYKNPGGSHINYGVNIRNVISDFSMADKHTYVLKNEVLPTGENMVHLYVDGTYIGQLNTQYLGGNTVQVENSTGISGMDFTFYYIGCTSSLQIGLFDATKIYNLEVHSKTTLNNAYEWKPGVSGLTSVVTSDYSGNQIVFDRDTDGIIEAEDGRFTLDSKGLKFEVNDFMDDRYSIYVAMAIHDKNYSPTALDVDGIDIGYEAQMYKKVTILPANVVYYEDDFPAIHYMGTEVNSFEELTADLVSGYDDYSDTYYMHTGSSEGLTQSPDQDTPYGSDPTYNDISTNVSGGTVHTIAINNDGPLAWFTFEGRGFEIDARTNAVNSGTVMVEVYNKSDVTVNSDGTLSYDMTKALQIIPVISEYDNGNLINGSFQGNNGGSEAIYQVPLIRYDCTTVSELTVIISGVEDIDYYNSETHIDSYLYLDGIRIYRPLGTTVTEYDEQNRAIFEEVRDHIVNGDILALDYVPGEGTTISTSTTVWTEKYNSQDVNKSEYIGSVVTDVSDYLMEGPNNEVYIEGTFTTGAIALYVREMTATNVGATKLLHIGVRSIDAGLYHGAGSTGMKANLKLGVRDGENIGWMQLATITSGTEQYVNVNYQLCPTVKINDSNYYQVVIKVESFSDDIPAMVSFTNIKRTSGLEVCKGQFEEANMDLLKNLSVQMAATRYISMNEVESGAAFDSGDGSVTENPTILPKYPTLALESEVSYNIYFDIANMDDVGTSDMGLLLFDSKRADGNIDNASSVIPGAVYSESAGYYRVQTGGIAAKKLGDTIYFKVYAKLPDGSYVYSDVYGYNAVQYVNEIFANSSNDKMKALCVAMLNYGAAAQTYFNYKTDALMNAGLTAEQQALVKAYSADIVADISVDSTKLGNFAYTQSGFSGASAAVSFEGAFAINYYVTPNSTPDDYVTLYYWTQDAYETADKLTAENASGSVNMTKVGNKYMFTYHDIAAKEVNEAVYIAAEYTSGGTRHCTGLIGYSVGAYCEDVIENSGSTQVAIDFAEATALYGHYAEEYFA